MPNVTIVGTTSWGTTLGIIMARQGTTVRMLARNDDEAERLQTARENARFVPDVTFPDSMTVTADPNLAFENSDLVGFVVPSRSLRDNAKKVASFVNTDSIVVTATKGLELGSGKRMSQILEEELGGEMPHGVCALSGPNLAREIVAEMPSSTVIASSDPDAANRAQAIINSSVFRVYTNDDIVGVEFCGALKNIIALGAGIVDGLGLGDNSKAAFMTRGLAEITRLGVASGAKPITFAGLAGMGDLIATCSSTLSRNHFVGEQLAEGRNLTEIRGAMQNVAEGVDTTPAAVELADRLGVEMPIARMTHKILFDGLSVREAIAELMGRNPTSE
ncbi:MAG: NAD(P)H-dependent glycerol-3-phosphate dehydrogenase [SAR202 cluster bacterium]|jgi:glycerol-3-phosphate dehydrogenase (NAD(P)+)|nr:NAD(P)H-dependent glycerol-3-phosphate dehydrogenase [SAR202 cluster bacterium]MDP6714009.1 NAD(P)H-dependent glycerol-3-phosphate dehydrogenase [SAR202 cluster bacterium]